MTIDRKKLVSFAMATLWQPYGNPTYYLAGCTGNGNGNCNGWTFEKVIGKELITLLPAK